jgi:hypothetical protein
MKPLRKKFFRGLLFEKNFVASALKPVPESYMG